MIQPRLPLLPQLVYHFASMSNVVTLSLPQQTIDKMISFYAQEKEENPSEYMLFFARTENCSISIYNKEKDGLRKVVFQGKKAEYEASIWGAPSPAPSSLRKAVTPIRKPNPLDYAKARESVGSDEVGTGDFFGPVIVVAAFVSLNDLKRLQELGVTDSKLMSDSRILEIGPELIHTYDYSELCLNNAKYNEVQEDGLNMNEIKAKMHNRCLGNVLSRHPLAKAFVDQFAAEKTYYGYLKHEENVVRNIVFATKGESKFPCVALASVIARYAFLRKMKAMGEEYGVVFPLGAGPQVDEFAKQFVQKHGKKALRQVAKLNFKNSSRI